MMLAAGCNPLDPLRVVNDEQRIASIAIAPDSANAVVGDTVRFSVTLRGANNTVVTGRSTTWTVGNPIVATISDSGLVTARAAGRSEILATVGNYRVAGVVIVSAPPASP